MPIVNISWKSVPMCLCNVTNRQTDRPTEEPTVVKTLPSSFGGSNNLITLGRLNVHAIWHLLFDQLVSESRSKVQACIWWYSELLVINAFQFVLDGNNKTDIEGMLATFCIPNIFPCANHKHKYVCTHRYRHTYTSMCISIYQHMLGGSWAIQNDTWLHKCLEPDTCPQFLPVLNDIVKEFLE